MSSKKSSYPGEARLESGSSVVCRAGSASSSDGIGEGMAGEC